jgi:hypothetical protein
MSFNDSLSFFTEGIVPISCEELFVRINEKRKSAGKGEEYQCTFSMLEIYNEQVRDLLNIKSAKAGGLKVRQHPSKGFYGRCLFGQIVQTGS